MKPKSNPKNKHQWGKSLPQDLNRLIGGKGNEGMSQKERNKD